MTAVAQSDRTGRRLVPVKLVNASLAMAWNFTATFVFAHLLGIVEFSNFILLLALANFTIAAEFGVTNILYKRLRGHVLGTDGNFETGEIQALFVALTAVVVIASVILVTALALGIFSTSLPALFMGVFILAALNMTVLLAKRGLAAMDRNFAFETFDCGRRILCLALLLASLVGLDLTVSIYAQLIVIMAEVFFAMTWMLRLAKQRGAIETGLGGGFLTLRKFYAPAAAPAMALTLSEIAAYNLPFILITALIKETAPLLLFDFLYKMLRALGIYVRVGAESALPSLTSAMRSGDRNKVIASLTKTTVFSYGGVLLAILLLGLFGGPLIGKLYAGKLTVASSEIVLICVALAILPIAAISGIVNAALNKFWSLLRASMFILAAAIAAPLLTAYSWQGQGFVLLALYLTGYLAAGLLHARLLRQLVVGIKTETVS